SNNKPGYDFSYTDYKLGVTKDFGGGLSANISYVGTDAKSVAGSPLYLSPQGKNLGKDGYLISLTKTF
ncbi:MAG: TorF family putative porin, partial [Polynucleobacter sp.]